MAPDIKTTGNGGGNPHPVVDSSSVGNRCPMMASSTTQTNGIRCETRWLVFWHHRPRVVKPSLFVSNRLFVLDIPIEGDENQQEARAGTDSSILL